MSMTLSCQKEITIAFLNPTESGTYLSGPVKSFCPPKCSPYWALRPCGSSTSTE